jgi:hypothetical protein
MSCNNGRSTFPTGWCIAVKLYTPNLHTLPKPSWEADRQRANWIDQLFGFRLPRLSGHCSATDPHYHVIGFDYSSNRTITAAGFYSVQEPLPPSLVCEVGRENIQGVALFAGSPDQIYSHYFCHSYNWEKLLTQARHIYLGEKPANMKPAIPITARVQELKRTGTHGD